ncbi:LemA family protein [Actinopolymorpha alba]|uniref:LemA family protein n=1 Tax=Actinopolymorpha alba TaxID=533267 RepID=UPI00036C5465|nr:LemA family protein [Actinopolymorpha alba]
MIGIIVAVVIVAIALAAGWVVSHNRFVSQRKLVRESWRQVDVELHRRYELVPSLAQAVRAHASAESGVFDEVAQLRTAAMEGDDDLARRARQESALSEGLRELFAVAESCPGLASDQQFLGLRQQLAETEDRIAAGRRFYNANVRAYNTRVEAFPSSIVASRSRFATAECFEVEEAEVRATPATDFTDLGAAASNGAQPGLAAPAPGSTQASSTPDRAEAQRDAEVDHERSDDQGDRRTPGLT